MNNLFTSASFCLRPRIVSPLTPAVPSPAVMRRTSHASFLDPHTVDVSLVPGLIAHISKIIPDNIKNYLIS